MNRILLTLLALLAGLVATGSPVQARAWGGREAEVGAVEVPAGGERVSVQRPALSAPSAGRSRGGQQRAGERPLYQTVHIAVVRIGPDRARE